MHVSKHIPEQLRWYKIIQRSKKVSLICKHTISLQISDSAYRRIHLELNKTATVGLGKHPKKTTGLQKNFNVQWRKSGPLADPSVRRAIWVGRGPKHMK